MPYSFRFELSHWREADRVSFLDNPRAGSHFLKCNFNIYRNKRAPININS